MKVWNDFYEKYLDKEICIAFEDDFKVTENSIYYLKKAISFIEKNGNEIDILFLHNLRKIYPEYNEQLGMLSCLPAVVKKNDDLQHYLKKLSRKTLEENLLNNYHSKPCISSLLNMKVASFIDETKIVKDVCDIKYYKEFILIMPENTDKKYIRAVYVY